MKFEPQACLTRWLVALAAASPGVALAGFQAASAPASSPVPEPGTLVLVGIGVVAAVVAARKRRK